MYQDITIKLADILKSNAQVCKRNKGSILNECKYRPKYYLNVNKRKVDHLTNMLNLNKEKKN